MAQPRVANPLEPLCEGWQRGLAIVAHRGDRPLDWTGQADRLLPGHQR
jgi:hypothetical protein